MTFARDDMVRRGPEKWTYRTTDSLSTVLAAGYFNDVHALLEAGDTIDVSLLSDLLSNPSTTALSHVSLLVSALSGGTVTTESASQTSLGLINVRDYGAVGDGVTDDTAAFQAAFAAAEDGDVILIPKPSVYYWVTADPFASLAAGRHVRVELRGILHTGVQLVLPNNTTIHGDNRRENNTNPAGAKIRASGSFTMPADGTRSLVRIGPNDGNYVIGAALYDLLVDGNSQTGIVGVYGDRLQEMCGAFNVKVQGCRQGFDFPYAATAGTGRNANFRIVDCEVYNIPEVSTTLSSTASIGATSIAVASATAMNLYDMLAIVQDGGTLHHATITNIAGTTITFQPATTINATSGNAVHHASPAVAVWSGTGTLIQRNTFYTPSAVIPLNIGLRAAGYGLTINSLHSEAGRAAVELGNDIKNMGASLASHVIDVSNITMNTKSIAGCGVVRIVNRDASAFTYKHYVRSVTISQLQLLSSVAASLITDEGTGSGGTGREAHDLTSTVYGYTYAGHYRVGESYPSASYGPRTFIESQEGRRTATWATGNIDDFDPTYGRYFRVTPDAGGGTVLTSVSGGRFAREVCIANVGSAAFTLQHNSGGTTENRLYCSTGADISVPANGVAKLVYGIGYYTNRWYAWLL